MMISWIWRKFMTTSFWQSTDTQDRAVAPSAWEYVPAAQAVHDDEKEKSKEMNSMFPDVSGPE